MNSNLLEYESYYHLIELQGRIANKNACALKLEIFSIFIVLQLHIVLYAS